MDWKDGSMSLIIICITISVLWTCFSVSQIGTSPLVWQCLGWAFGRWLGHEDYALVNRKCPCNRSFKRSLGESLCHLPGKGKAKKTHRALDAGDLILSSRSLKKLNSYSLQIIQPLGSLFQQNLLLTKIPCLKPLMSHLSFSSEDLKWPTSQIQGGKAETITRITLNIENWMKTWSWVNILYFSSFWQSFLLSPSDTHAHIHKNACNKLKQSFSPQPNFRDFLITSFPFFFYFSHPIILLQPFY